MKPLDVLEPGTPLTFADLRNAVTRFYLEVERQNDIEMALRAAQYFREVSELVTGTVAASVAAQAPAEPEPDAVAG